MSTMNHVSVPVGSYLGSPPPPPPRVVDAEPSCSDSDSDHDHPAQEPEFVMDAVDDDRRRRAPPAAVRLPIVRPHAADPVANWERQAMARARTERLQYHMLFPQVAICVCILSFGSMTIYLATNPGMFPDPNFTWLIVFSALVMILSLLSLLLSHLAVNVYGM